MKQREGTGFKRGCFRRLRCRRPSCAVVVRFCPGSRRSLGTTVLATDFALTVAARMLRAEAREGLGQFSQASRDCTNALKSSSLLPADSKRLEQLSGKIAEGLRLVAQAGIDNPTSQRVFEVTSEGLLRRRRIELLDLERDGRCFIPLTHAHSLEVPPSQHVPRIILSASPQARR